MKMNPSRTIALVIPCYNESTRLKMAEFSDFMDQHPSIVVCFVNDGSTDATLPILERFAAGRPDHVRITNLAQNQGKAEAVRQGICTMVSDPRWTLDTIGFMDADLATPLTEVDRFLEAFRGPIEAVVGSRQRRKGVQIHRSVGRGLMAVVVRKIIAIYLRLPIRDTQCGAKFFTAALARELFSEPFVSRWVFDLELFCRMRQRYAPDALTSHVHELPLRCWHDVPGSKLRFHDTWRIVLELIRVHAHYRQTDCATPGC